MTMSRNVAQCLLVAKILAADGMITDDERAFLTATATRLGLTDAERHQVSELAGIDEAEALLRSLPHAEREAVLELLVNAASADGHLGKHELATVQQVARALGLA